MPSAIELLREYGLRPKKSWGQNFLIDKNALDRIVAACALSPEDAVIVEIGAGTGALTERLLAPGRTVLAVERERDMAKILYNRFGGEPGVEVVETNAVGFSLKEAALRAGGPVKVVGNPPYQISAPILFKLIAERKHVKSAHLLLQKEVAARLGAKPGSRDYGLLAVILGRVAVVSRETDVRRTCFFPVPKVDSRFVSIYFDAAPPAPPSDELFLSFVKAAFHKRRAKLVNSLKRQNFLALSGSILAGLEKRFPEWMAARAEERSVGELIEMARAVEEQQ